MTEQNVLHKWQNKMYDTNDRAKCTTQMTQKNVPHKWQSKSQNKRYDTCDRTKCTIQINTEQNVPMQMTEAKYIDTMW